jgi:Fe-coproporphyrin III synthase
LPDFGGPDADQTKVAMGPGPVPLPVLQIHASLKCNLFCAHCYSQSGPSAAGAIAVENIRELLEDAAQLGYRAVAFSGGEPLIYPGITEALRQAKALGLKTSVTTNGTLLDPARLEALDGLVTVLAISIDGPPYLHNKIRGSSSAFQRLSDGIGNVRSTGIPFGFIHTLTRESWEHLAWVADFAHQNGATLYHIHPLEMFGRAEQTMGESMPDEDVLMRSYLLGNALIAKYHGKMTVQLDIVHRDQLMREPIRVYATNEYDIGRKAAELLSVVVLEPDGCLVPVAYGFSRRLKICNIYEERFAAAWGRYAETGYSLFRRLCCTALMSLASPTAPQLLNWHDLIVRQSLGWPKCQPLHETLTTQH